MRHPGQDGTSQIRTGTAEARRSGVDLRAWSEALYELPTGPVSESDFRAWLEGPLRRFFPFRQFFGAYGRLSGNRVQMQALITSGHCPAFVASRRSTFDLKLHGCFAWFVSTRRAVLLDKAGAIDAAGMQVTPTEREVDDLERFSLGALALHGVIDPFARSGTYLGFSGVPTAQPTRLLALLELVSRLQVHPFDTIEDLLADTHGRQRERIDDDGADRRRERVVTQQPVGSELQHAAPPRSRVRSYRPRG